MSQPPRLSPGDRLPFAYGMDAAQRFWSFENQAGAPSILLVAGAHAPAEVAGALIGLAARRGEIAEAGGSARVLAAAGAPGWATAKTPAGLDLSHVMDDALAEALGAEPCLAVADAALRLVGRFPLSSPDAVEAAAAALRAEAAAEPLPAPVLIAPRVLDQDACARLIAAFEGGAHTDGAMASVDAEGRAISRIDAAKKHRRDLELKPGDPLHGEVLDALSRRLLPEMAKAFQAHPAHLDRILIARYDDSGGYFRRHRDNSSPHLAYREFALSLNLNTGDYEGGELVFPEFGARRYSPPRGGAMVFSASLLHEALPVRRGARYVLLTFLHGEAAETRRLAALGEGVREPA